MVAGGLRSRIKTSLCEQGDQEGSGISTINIHINDTSWNRVAARREPSEGRLSARTERICEVAIRIGGNQAAGGSMNCKCP
jgi:hypothetical protein